MAEWFFFISLLMIAIIVCILAIRRKEHIKKVNNVEGKNLLDWIGEAIDKAD
jgi:hypothetical protein